MEVQSIANITSVDLSLQEGKYIDDRVQMSFTTIDKLGQVIREPKVF